MIEIIGGFPTGRDGRVHGTFTHNPSSLRLSMVDPNMQNIPRGSDSEIEKWVKECFHAPKGFTFWKRDYSGIEAVLVGYFAGSARYVRLAKLGAHAFLASHILGRPASLDWSDADLRGYFKEVKQDKSTYDKAKRTVHASNYMVSPRKLTYEYPEVFPSVKEASALQGLYFDLFPEIRDWHRELCLRVDGTKRRKVEDGEEVEPWSLGVCYARNPFDYVHRFYNVLDWEKIGDEWIWGFGEDAKRLISFLPQSTAAAIIKRSAKKLWYEVPWVGQTMRLLIHDEIFGEAKEGDEAEMCLEVSRKIMESPIEELPLNPDWGMGEFLSIGSEGGIGPVWAGMKGVA
jgi:hypothetical protein